MSDQFTGDLRSLSHAVRVTEQFLDRSSHLAQWLPHTTKVFPANHTHHALEACASMSGPKMHAATEMPGRPKRTYSCNNA